MFMHVDVVEDWFNSYLGYLQCCHESQTRLLTLIILGLLTSGKLQRVDKMADESRGANTKHRVKQWALIRTESNTYYHDISPLLR